MGHCIYCGNEIPNDALFCNKCGKKQETVTSTFTPAKDAEVPAMAETGENPTTFDEWFDKGNNFFDKKQYKDALECFNQTILLDPSNSSALFNKALCLWNLHKYFDAIYMPVGK